MLLAVDARNRSVTVGFREGASWLAVRRFGASPERSADEYAFLMTAAARESGREDGPRFAEAEADGPTRRGLVTSAWISSVSPSLTTRLTAAVASAFGVEALVVGPGTRTGLKIRTDNPQEVGSDLVCASIAAKARVGSPVIVVGMGEAIVLSAIDAEGAFVGAAIAPGIDAGLETLRSSAALIPGVRIETPRRAIGRCTAESIRSGLVFGNAGLVAHLIERIRAELAAESPPGTPIAEVIGTGDPSFRALLAAAGVERFEEGLALEGIALIAEKNG